MLSLRHSRFSWLLPVLGVSLIATLLYNLRPQLASLSLGYLQSENADLQAQSEEPSLPDHLNAVEVETRIPGTIHVHGFTVFDELYLRNGTFYVVTSNPSAMPPRRNILSKPLPRNIPNLDPTDEQLQIISPEKAREILGKHATRIRDVSVIVYDPMQFMHHFYHWWGEVILGFWRVYAAAVQNDTEGIATQLPLPARFLLPFVYRGEWRDKAGVDGPLMRAAFPGASIEESDHWRDLAQLGTTVVFDRVILVNRWSAHKHPFGSVWFKMIAGTMSATVTGDFFKPVRESLVENLVGYVPQLDHRGIVMSPAQAVSDRPIVTYVSREGGGRKLLAKDRDSLVDALKELESAGICEFHVAIMERLTLEEQVKLASRSTVIVGVHGNGLTHQLWMPPTARSTVIEIFYPSSYVFDYEILARNMGHRHYAVWNDTLVTYPEGTTHKGVHLDPHFHGNEIPAFGPAIADTIRRRLFEPIDTQ